MKLSMLDRKQAARGMEHVIDREGATLRVVERPTPPGWEPFVIVGGAASAAGAPVSARAEIRARRFRDGRVAEDRYEAKLNARDDSPAALMRALVDAFSELPEFRAGGDERVVLQISLSR